MLWHLLHRSLTPSIRCQVATWNVVGPLSCGRVFVNATCHVLWRVAPCSIVSRLNNTRPYLVCDTKCTLMTYLHIKITEMPPVGKIATSIERARDCGVRVLDVIAVIVWLPGTPLCHGSREHGKKGYQ